MMNRTTTAPSNRHLFDTFETLGFQRFANPLPSEMTDVIADVMERDGRNHAKHGKPGAIYAARDVFARHPDLLKLAGSGPLLTLARNLAGEDAIPTKATFFDKRPEANWTLPLHQDLTITLANRAEVPGYTHWSTKAGVPHVQPPTHVLEATVALRIHLDDCPEENGALLVVPGSHRLGRLAAAELRRMHDTGAAIPCAARAGDVLAMRPLLVHGSRKATRPSRRRVLHIEYCAETLEPSLRWPDWSA